MKILKLIDKYLSQIALLIILLMPILLFIIIIFNLSITIFYIACVILWLLLFITSLAYMFYNTLSNS
jgi:hypothetical protein